MFKDNKTTGFLFKILVTLCQRLFWEVASALRNVFTSYLRKLGC